MFAGRDPVTGKKRRISKTVHGGKRVAQREIATMIAEVDEGFDRYRRHGRRPHRALARTGGARAVAVERKRI